MNMVIPTYIINLKSCPDRKAYMEKELAPFPFLEQVFIEAVDGRIMTCAEQEKVFDQNSAYKRYGRIAGCGEVGCTLSHLECCRLLVESGAPYALFVEDDLVIRESTDFEKVIEALSGFLSTDKPTIVLLIGDFWFLSKKDLYGRYRLAKVYDAVCTGAYLINTSAAKRMLNMGGAHIADDWRLIRKQGIGLFGVTPHLTDQDRLNFDTTIANYNTGKSHRANMRFKARMESYLSSGVKRILKACNHFEYKNFRW